MVGLAHSLSHFFQLALPPLFPLLKAEFGVSYAVLGSLIGVFYALSGLTQFAAGFIVDRFGARPVRAARASMARASPMTTPPGMGSAPPESPVPAPPPICGFSYDSTTSPSIM